MRGAAECAAPAGALAPAGQYQAAHAAVVLAERADLGRVRFAGKDAADLLHRLSTNAIKGLRQGSGAATVLTTNKGRILDLITLHRTGDAYLGLCASGRVRAVLDWIERYTFREVVTAEDQTASHRTFGLHGPRAAAVVARLFGAAAADLPLHGVAEASLGTAPVLVVRSFPLAGESFLLTVQAESAEALRAEVRERAGEPVVEAGAAMLEVLRVEAGLPAAGRELTEEHNPWEARLDDAISLTKGCYVGQEVVARLHNYKKVARQLVRIAIPAAPVAVAPGDPVRAGAETIGVLTSSVIVPDGAGRTLALGYVRTGDATAGRPVEVEHAGAAVPAVIEGVAR
ncbi:MAG TPA: glycine cleavage T C-terminal barrel domain-containing protein [Patescibacteria group bacterium]|nr:glycine cleavage T C-terminal barrel domain-containing protein [Patescibacteria group bacterium]